MQNQTLLIYLHICIAWVTLMDVHTTTDQFVGATRLTGTREKKLKLDTAQRIAALCWLRLPIKFIYSCAVAVAAHSRMQNRVVSADASREAYLFVLVVKEKGENARSSFFSFFYPSLMVSVVKQADLYHDPVALTPVTVTGYALTPAQWQQTDSWTSHYEMTLVKCQ